jgi:signal transduction histidine kinase
MASELGVAVVSRGAVEVAAPLVETDALDNITFWSPKAELLLGWSAADAVGRSLGGWLVARRDRARFRRWWEELALARGSRLEELSVICASGAELTTLFKVLPPSERTSALRVSIRALTDEPPLPEREPPVHETSEEDLRRHHRLIQHILNYVPHGIFWKDRESRFLGGNAEFVAYADGVETIEDMLGKTDHDFFAYEQAQHYRDCDVFVMQTGQPLLDVVEPIARGDETRFLLTSKVPLRNDSGAIIGVLGIFADITERRRMEKALQAATLSAESAARAKSEFLTVVSHELRTPLTLILGPLDILLAKELPADTRTELERMRRNATRLQLLVNDILDTSKIEAGRAEVVSEPVDVARLLREIVGDANAAASARGLSLSFVEHGSLGVVSIDRGKLERIVLNLVANALKFTPAGGRIVVELIALEGNGCEIAVTDTGIGIPLEQQQGLFERFHQVDSSVRRNYGGTGLGLSLVKKLAELMGGSAGVKSKAGTGSRFYVRFDALPAALLDETSAAASPSLVQSRLQAGLPLSHVVETPPPPVLAARGAEEGEAARGRVLVVEDNADMRAFVMRVLAEDYVVEGAEDGEVGLAAARARPFDVIVSDIMMPKMDGMELVSQLKQDPELRNIPVVLLTAKTTGDELVSGLVQGADDYVRKPFSPSELKARVQAALRLRRTIRDLEVTLAALRHTQAELIQSEKMAAVGTLIAGLSHELNNPLAVISMNTELLLERPGSKIIADRALPIIRAQTERCAQLVHALLDFARRKEAAREELSVSALLGPLHALAVPMGRQQDVELVLEGAALAENLARVYVCRQEMETAILNLVTNAIAATPKGGRVAMRAELAPEDGGNGVILSVADTGPGIPEDVLARVFDPFFTTKPPGKGTGIGLPLALRIVQAHGGNIRIESEVGRGTVASIWLPLPAKEAAS